VASQQTAATTRPELTARTVTEHQGRSVPGIPVLVLGIVLILAGIGVIWLGAENGTRHGGGAGTITIIAVGVLLILCGDVGVHGLTPVVAGEARVLQLFGRYTGTIRAPGLRWVNPFTRRRKVSTRIRNHETPVTKVNDADGNPVEIAAVVVWRVLDTAAAVFTVDDFAAFVAIQTEAAVRHIAGSYPYDSRGSGAMSLLGNAGEVTGRLSAQIADRVSAAGVQIIESRLTRLSYAPEIAQAMLRQQQASAVVGARQQIVAGAVGMVQLALGRLQHEGIVELDEARKAAMVSNLLVVLCSEQATRPIVNTGTLYH
jgi:regulator of protease activity HflC (stomatin/prohibitin superfamily)